LGNKGKLSIENGRSKERDYGDKKEKLGVYKGITKN